MKIEELFGTLQMSVVSGWRKHLRSAKYGKHVALQEFYEEMPDKVDALIEAWMGANGKKTGNFENLLSSANYNTLNYLHELKKVCKQGYELLDENEELESLLDDIVNLINSTLYKIKELNECVVSLSDFINEAINEAKRVNLDSLSDGEAIYFYWEAWSGFESNGRRSGISSNPKAEKLANYLSQRFPASDYFGNVCEKVTDLDDHLREMFGVGRNEQYRFNNLKIPAAMMTLIKDNLEWLTSGKEDKNYKIK